MEVPANRNGLEIPGLSIPGLDIPGSEIPGSEILDWETPGSEIRRYPCQGLRYMVSPDSAISDSDFPGLDIPGSVFLGEIFWVRWGWVLLR
jgi:hypothetical protein